MSKITGGHWFESRLLHFPAHTDSPWGLTIYILTGPLSHAGCTLGEGVPVRAASARSFWGCSGVSGREPLAGGIVLGSGISVYIVSVLSKSHLGHCAFYGPVVKSLKVQTGDGRNKQPTTSL